MTTQNKPPPIAEAPPIAPISLSQKTPPNDDVSDTTDPLAHTFSQTRTPLLQDISTAVALKTPKTAPVAYRCGIKDRFDRQALLAYEWDRNRLSLNADGLGFNGADSVRLEYNIKLHRDKPIKRKCRTSSQWQGMVGTGYHELLVRKDNTVLDEVRILRKQVTGHIKRHL